MKNEQVKREYLGELDIPALTGQTQAADRPRVVGHEVEMPAKKEAAPFAEIKFEDEEKRARPRIVFSKPRRRKQKVKSPFKSTDLD